MARPARPRLAAPAPRGPVTAPAELLVGALAEIWAADAHPFDLGGAFGRYQSALLAWQIAEHLTVAEMCAAVAVPRSPWSLATYDGGGSSDGADARLAAAGVARNDLPRLRRAAQARTRTTDNRRTS